MKLLLKNYQSPGDILMLTSAVRDLKNANPDIEVNVDTSAMPLWDNNPYLSREINEENADKVIEMHYPLVHKSDELPYHFIHAFRMELQTQLMLPIPQGEFKPDVHLTEDEENNPLEDVAGMGEYWIIDAGYKEDFTLKNWGLSRYQEVVDLLKDTVQFVQIGECFKNHVHRPLKGVKNMIGKTDIRGFVRLMKHASGVLTPVSFPMHLSSAIPMKDGRIRPCVVIAGAREPAHWEQYPGHTFFQNIGMFDCCRKRSCWKSRAEKLNDGSELDTSICSNPYYGDDGECVGLCMAAIEPAIVALSISNYVNFRK